jgi:hypothetical protein
VLPLWADTTHSFVQCKEINMPPFKDDLIFSKPSIKHALISFAILFLTVLVVAAITPDGDDGANLSLLIDQGVIAVAVGLALRRGWLIGSEAHATLTGTGDMKPAIDKGGIAWRAAAVFIALFAVTAILDTVLGATTTANVLTTLFEIAAAPCVGLYVGEHMGWKAADYALTSRSVATPP